MSLDSNNIPYLKTKMGNLESNNKRTACDTSPEVGKCGDKEGRMGRRSEIMAGR